jgi:hypothetical protein
VKYRVHLAMLMVAVLSCAAFAQVSSRFDLTGNVSLGNAQFFSAPGTTGAGKIRALGWESSGTSHFNSWLGMTSQFTGGYASADSIQLAGYTGTGKIQHYSSLVGPRITFASRSRFRPFVEGLGGIDFATTKFTNNGTLVYGRELQSAYAIGGGAQIGITRRVGLNVQAHYLETQHSVGFLGWTPSHLQLSAGLVFRLSNLRDRIIVDQKPAPIPSPSSDTQTASAEPANLTVQPVAPAPVTTMVVTASPDTTAQRTVIQRTIASRSLAEQAVAPAPSQFSIAPVPQLEAKAQPVSAMAKAKIQPAIAPPAVKVQPAVVAAVVVTPSAPSRPVQTQAQVQAPPAPAIVARGAASSAPATAYAQPQQAAPLSLGEYARKLREQKKQQHNSEW